ncbi:hypothetical protein DPEC_G00064070 [Dallia pectoralis]|uniref:Uncharacterized protein n=1 Tax=Dallia pectoralis TaxID=75939 RepID=A0ACC2H819_DALPE|nr:hypothetical protein DPEC_G00064070 [Dallia pectoralis]
MYLGKIFVVQVRSVGVHRGGGTASARPGHVVTGSQAEPTGRQTTVFQRKQVSADALCPRAPEQQSPSLLSNQTAHISQVFPPQRVLLPRTVLLRRRVSLMMHILWQEKERGQRSSVSVGTTGQSVEVHCRHCRVRSLSDGRNQTRGDADPIPGLFDEVTLHGRMFVSNGTSFGLLKPPRGHRKFHHCELSHWFTSPAIKHRDNLNMDPLGRGSARQSVTVPSAPPSLLLPESKVPRQRATNEHVFGSRRGGWLYDSRLVSSRQAAGDERQGERELKQRGDDTDTHGMGMGEKAAN